ncbi:MAG: hypothetical protein JSR87_03845 [Proteobacteria bacterium]|nr:hypothetical protein [Pseudomonadota bacterium]MBS0572013.1 hypothetical protein [Pseudomonadota bacterium]
MSDKLNYDRDALRLRDNEARERMKLDRYQVTSSANQLVHRAIEVRNKLHIILLKWKSTGDARHAAAKITDIAFLSGYDFDLRVAIQRWAEDVLCFQFSNQPFGYEADRPKILRTLEPNSAIRLLEERYLKRL